MLSYLYSSFSLLRPELEKYTNKNKHLALSKRYDIEHSLNNRESFKAIGRLLGKDCTTIAKEVKSHIVYEKKGAPYRPFNDCLNRKSCDRYGDACSVCARKNNRNKCSSCGKCSFSVSAKCEGGFSTFIFYEKIVPGNT